MVMLILGAAMKRSSSEEAGKEISPPSKKQNKRKADKLDSFSDNSSRRSDPRVRDQMQLATEASIERRSQGLAGPAPVAVASYHQGVPHSLMR